jgi:hypothetical protein
MGSGLMVASKYPVMAADFVAYSVQVGRASQGVLMVKVGDKKDARVAWWLP